MDEAETDVLAFRSFPIRPKAEFHATNPWNG